MGCPFDDIVRVSSFERCEETGNQDGVFWVEEVRFHLQLYILH